MIYNLIKGECLNNITYEYTSYLSEIDDLMINLTIVFDYDPNKFNGFTEGEKLRDIVVGEFSIYLHYAECELLKMNINNEDNTIFMFIKAKWFVFYEELPQWLIVDIRKKTIDTIIN